MAYLTGYTPISCGLLLPCHIIVWKTITIVEVVWSSSIWGSMSDLYKTFADFFFVIL